MTEPCATTNGSNGVSGAELQAQARDLYRSKLAEGVAVSGTELGSLFDRSPQWGRMVAAQARAEANGDALPDGGGANGRGGRANGPQADHDSDANERQGANDDHHDDANGSSVGANGLQTDRDGDASERQSANDDHHDDANAPGQRRHSGASGMAVTPRVRLVTTLAVLSVALVAAVVSFEHQRELALVAGEGWRSALLPISVDGLVVAASMTMVSARRAGQAAGALAWVALLLGVGASLAANVIAADPGLVDPAALRRVVAGWPPLALGISFELLVRQLRSDGPVSTGCRGQVEVGLHGQKRTG